MRPQGATRWNDRLGKLRSAFARAHLMSLILALALSQACMLKVRSPQGKSLLEKDPLALLTYRDGALRSAHRHLDAVVAGINTSGVENPIFKALGATVEQIPADEANEKISKTLDLLLSNPKVSSDGASAIYTPDPALCTQVLAPDQNDGNCLEQLLTFSVSIIAQDDSSGRAKIHWHGLTPLQFSYSPESITFDLNLTEGIEALKRAGSSASILASGVLQLELSRNADSSALTYAIHIPETLIVEGINETPPDAAQIQQPAQSASMALRNLFRRDAAAETPGVKGASIPSRFEISPALGLVSGTLGLAERSSQVGLALPEIKFQTPTSGLFNGDANVIASIPPTAATFTPHPDTGAVSVVLRPMAPLKLKVGDVDDAVQVTLLSDLFMDWTPGVNESNRDNQSTLKVLSDLRADIEVKSVGDTIGNSGRVQIRADEGFALLLEERKVSEGRLEISGSMTPYQEQGEGEPQTSTIQVTLSPNDTLSADTMNLGTQKRTLFEELKPDPYAQGQTHGWCKWESDFSGGSCAVVFGGGNSRTECRIQSRDDHQFCRNWADQAVFYSGSTEPELDPRLTLYSEINTESPQGPTLVRVLRPNNLADGEPYGWCKWYSDFSGGYCGIQIQNQSSYFTCDIHSTADYAFCDEWMRTTVTQKSPVIINSTDPRLKAYDLYGLVTPSAPSQGGD